MASPVNPALNRYRQLLRDYHAAIDQRDWPERIKPLIREMDSVWSKLRGQEQEAALEYAKELYQRRINP